MLDRDFRSAAQRGFSFIEILVVMGIIAALAGLSVVVLQIMGEEAPEMQTRDRLTKTQSSINAFKQKFSYYPPMTLKELPARIGRLSLKVSGRINQENQGIETLYQALTIGGFESGSTWEGNEIANVDEDELKTAINSLNNVQLFEIVDAYDPRHPLIYIPARRYAETEKKPIRYMNGHGDVFDAVAYRDEKTGNFAQPQSFQLFSVGPDGEPNTEDDIKAWTVGE